MKRSILFYLFFLPILMFGQVYITTDTQLANTVFKSNTKYVIQGNLETTRYLPIENVDNVTITGMGSGSITANFGSKNRAIIRVAQSDNVVIEDLFLSGENSPVSPLAGVFISGHYNAGGRDATNIKVNRCDISYSYNGVRAMPAKTNTSNITVFDCHIHHIDEDGIILKNSPNPVVEENYIHHVNMDYGTGANEQTAPGDGVQLVGDCDNFLIKNNTIIRRYYANKFCFIYGRGSFTGRVTGAIIGNTMVGPFEGGYGGATMYLDFAEYILVKNNYFTGILSNPVRCIESRCDNVDLIGNVFDSIHGGSDVGAIKMYLDAVETNINDNIVKNSDGIIFHCFGTTSATDNMFCSFSGDAFYTTPGSGFTVNETGTIYQDECDGTTPPPDPDPDPDPDPLPGDTTIIEYYYQLVPAAWDTIATDTIVR